VSLRQAVTPVRRRTTAAVYPDWVFRPVGPASELDDIGHLGFKYGPADQPAATGMDIARTKDSFIIELYTIVTEIHQPS
jgi:hypothetical protein